MPLFRSKVTKGHWESRQCKLIPANSILSSTLSVLLWGGKSLRSQVSAASKGFSQSFPNAPQGAKEARGCLRMSLDVETFLWQRRMHFQRLAPAILPLVSLREVMTQRSNLVLAGAAAGDSDMFGAGQQRSSCVCQHGFPWPKPTEARRPGASECCVRCLRGGAGSCSQPSWLHCGRSTGWLDSGSISFRG